MLKDVFEKYSKWFDSIDNACNENTVRENRSSWEYFEGAEHYELENGVHVYKIKNGEVIICDEELEGEKSVTEVVSMRSDIKRGSFPPSSHIIISTRNNSDDGSRVHAQITYGLTDSGYYGKGELPAIKNANMSQVESWVRNMRDDSNEDIGQWLDLACKCANDNEMISEYKRAIAFYETIQQIVEREMSGYDEYGYPKEIEDDDTPGAISEDAELDDSNTGRTDDETLFSQAGDFTPDELEQMSTEELEEMLRATAEQNATKKQVLEETENEAKRKEAERRKALIAQIGQAVDEGRDLDAKITEARAITKENK